MINPKPGSLVLYKSRAALITGATDKIDIEIAGGEHKRVRPKDIRLLHPGPARLSELDAAAPATEEAWELLQGEAAPFAEFAELLFGEFTPAAAWGAWQLLQEDLWFDGDLDRVTARPTAEVQRLTAERDAQRRAQAEREALLARIAEGKVTAADAPALAEVERVAHDAGAQSRLLAHFGVAAKAEAAHAFLVRCGHWDVTHNPYPARAGIDLAPAQPDVPPLPDEPRRDLTHLPALAIDDAGNRDPDDAISLDGERIWVHIADVAALVPPDSSLDAVAVDRGATLYLPETTVPMLPPALTDLLGLGLADESPALSIGFRLGDDGVTDVELATSRVRVERLSYEQADARLEEPLLATLADIARRHRRLRSGRGAIELPLPEVMVRVVDGRPAITPLPRLPSRELVAECMLMAGAAAGRLLAGTEVAAPFVLQAAPEAAVAAGTLAETCRIRRQLRPSQTLLTAGTHAGLGLDNYVRVTSPLRRYLDLVVHQQLRAMLSGAAPLGADQVAARIQRGVARSGRVRRTERLSNLHWKLIWLDQRPGWQGEGVVIGLDDRKALVLVPELALEARVRRQEGMALDDRLRIRLERVDVPAQVAYFRVLD